MRRLLPLALPVLILSLALTAQAEERYSLKVKLDPQTDTLAGSALVVYQNDSEAPLDSLYFLLLPNFGRERNPYLDRSYIDQSYWEGFDPSWLQVQAVTDEGGEPLQHELLESPPEVQTYSLKDTFLRVALPAPLAPGQTASVKIEFATKFPEMVVGDQCHHREIYTWRFGWHPIAIPAESLVEGFPQPPPGGYYKFELPAAWYEAELTLPKEYVLAAGAEEQELVREDEGWKTFLLRSNFPVRSIPWSAGPAFARYGLEAGGRLVEVYYLPDHKAAARLFATYAVEVLERYEQLYGPLDYERVVIVESSARGLFGMTADGLVILGDSWFREKDLALAGMIDRFAEYVLAHELAHLYFGVGAGVDFNAENFLSEAFAQYLSISYYEEKYGGFGPNVFVFKRKGLVQNVIDYYLGFYNLRQHNVELPYLKVFKDRFDEALVKPEKEVEYGNYSTVRLYDKGYLVLRALAGQIGEERMRELLARVHRDYAHEIFTTADLQQLAEELSGQQLEGFFSNWLYGAVSVDYGIKRVTTTGESGNYLTAAQLVRRGEGALPVEVVALTEGGEELTELWEASEPEGRVEFRTASPVKEIRLDPRELTPDTNRLDNFYPPKVRVITTGKNDLPLDAYLLQLDPMSQTVAGGTLWYRWLVSVAQKVGAFAIYNGRGSVTRGYLDLGPLDQYGTIAGELSLELARYANPPVGSPAKFWEARDQLSFAIGRVLDAGARRGINYLGLGWTRSEAIAETYSFSAELLGYPLEFGRLALTSWHSFRLLPHLYLEERVQLGLGLDLPGPFRFRLDELRSFYQQVEGKWVKASFPGNAKLAGQLSLSLPAKRELDYDLANLAVLDELRLSLFLAFGKTWERFENLDLKEFHVEVGAEGRLSGETLGGLFPVSFTVGFAYPLLGIEPEGRRAQLYLEAEIPLL
ncbi:MAG: hypothetical protein NUW06_03070 [Candidatus Acetothermia bacterium]|nr:hypothetical protein [Candidatus Acetothermia bacterium]MDH7504826.1 M1 family aminopeptidase [Candidatus Acetothermia bacterium]